MVKHRLVGGAAAGLVPLTTCLLLLTLSGQQGSAQEIEARLTLPGGSYTAFSPDGKALVQWTGYKTGMRRWDLTCGKLQMPLIPNTKMIIGCFALSPDGRTLALGGRRTTRPVRLLDLATGKEKAVLTLDKPVDMRCLAFAPDGKTLAAGRDDAGEAILWDLATHKVRAILRGHRRQVLALAFSPNSRILATSCLNPDILLWQVDTGKPWGRLTWTARVVADLDSRWQLAFTPDGKTLIGAGLRGHMNLWDLATGKVTRLYYRHENIHGLALSPDGRTLAFVDDYTIYLFDMLTHEKRAVFESHMPKRHCEPLAFSPDGRTLKAGRFDDYTTLFDLAGVKGVKTPDAAALARLWSRLGPGKAPDAYGAIRTLSAFPRQTVPFLRQQFRPSLPPTAAQLRRLDRLAADLDNADFTVRQKAQDELKQAGEGAEASLRRALAGRPTLEVRKQAKELLDRIAHTRTTRLLQHLRALEVLEHMDDAGARDLLADLAKSAPEARIRDDAKASLERVRKRPPPTVIKSLPPEAPPRPKAPKAPARR